MPVRMSPQRDASLVIHEFIGPVEAGDFKTAIQGDKAAGPEARVLWDLSKAGPLRLSANEIRAVARLLVRASHGKGRLALVAADDFLFAISRQLQGYVDGEKNSPVVEVHRKRSTALHWLKADAAHA
jgi:hypothetical protein